MDLRDLAANAYVQGTYSLLNPQVGMTRAGKPFLKCLIRDASGEMAARKWSFEESMLDSVAATGFVVIAGHTQLYNNQVQMILEDIQPAEVTTEQMRDLMPTTTKDIDVMYGEVQALLGSLSHPAMKALAQAYLNDEALMASFKMAPAAMVMHHAWIGGLLEHTHQLMHLAEVMLPLYPQINRDIVLMGLFLHDLAKVSELTWERGFDYTADGNLIGHLVRGAIWLQIKSAVAARESGEKLPADALRVLQHIVISHHEKGEFGAAKTPCTPEAVFIALLDNLDAKTAMVLGAARRDDEQIGNEFTEKVWALGAKVYRPDPLAEAVAAAPVDAV